MSAWVELVPASFLFRSVILIVLRLDHVFNYNLCLMENNGLDVLTESDNRILIERIVLVSKQF